MIGAAVAEIIGVRRHEYTPRCRSHFHARLFDECKERSVLGSEPSLTPVLALILRGRFDHLPAKIERPACIENEPRHHKHETDNRWQQQREVTPASNKKERRSR